MITSDNSVRIMNTKAKLSPELDIVVNVFLITAAQEGITVLSFNQSRIGTDRFNLSHLYLSLCPHPINRAQGTAKITDILRFKTFLFAI